MLIQHAHRLPQEAGRRLGLAAKSELGLCQKRYYLVCSLQAAIVGGEQAEEDVLDHFEW